MSRNVKLLLWVLGGAAALNIAADVWFRLAVSTSTSAPWYVWAPAVGTVAVALLTLVGQAVFKRMRARTGDEAPAMPAQPAAEFVTVEYLVERDDADSRADATARALDALHNKTGRPWTAMHMQKALQHDGRWRFEVSCRAS